MPPIERGLSTHFGSRVAIRPRPGFTLVELVIVLAILGIAAAVAMPSVAGMIQGFRVRAVARQIMTDMQSARMGAVAQKTNFRVTVDVANNRYQIDKFDPAAGVWNQVGTRREISTEDTAYFAPGVTLGATSAPNALVVTFSPFGTATLSAAAADGSARASANSDGRVVTVIISPMGSMRIA
jgi:type II secretion system protein H